MAVRGSVGAGLKNPSSVNKAIYFLCRKPFLCSEECLFLLFDRVEIKSNRSPEEKPFFRCDLP